MSLSEVAFLVLVLTAFLTFICVVGYVSIWSGRPSKTKTHNAAVPTSVLPQSTKKHEAAGTTVVSLVEAHPPRAA